jgi:hypothetical protein
VEKRKGKEYVLCWEQVARGGEDRGRPICRRTVVMTEKGYFIAPLRWFIWLGSDATQLLLSTILKEEIVQKFALEHGLQVVRYF